MILIGDGETQKMSDAAWSARRNARILGATPVGCAAMSPAGNIYAGCNIEHRYRSHDIHAEVNAIGNLVAAGEQRLTAVLVAAERDRFTPCGACLDWIFELGGSECVVLVQNLPAGPVESLRAADLMPHYPR